MRELVEKDENLKKYHELGKKMKEFWTKERREQLSLAYRKAYWEVFR